MRFAKLPFHLIQTIDTRTNSGKCGLTIRRGRFLLTSARILTPISILIASKREAFRLERRLACNPFLMGSSSSAA